MPDPSPAADLTRLVAVIPLRSLEGAKTRLGGPLDAEERRDLVAGLLDRTIRAADAVGAIESVVVVSPDPAALLAATAAGATPVRQADLGLNEGLLGAARWAAADGASALLVLPADLPAVSDRTIAEVVSSASGAIEVGRPLVAIVPDRHGHGTNALLVSPPDVIQFAFGPDSRAAHREAGTRAGAVVLELGGPLSLDLDLPDDLILAEELGLLDPTRAG